MPGSNTAADHTVHVQSAQHTLTPLPSSLSAAAAASSSSSSKSTCCMRTGLVSVQGAAASTATAVASRPRSRPAAQPDRSHLNKPISQKIISSLLQLAVAPGHEFVSCCNPALEPAQLLIAVASTLNLSPQSFVYLFSACEWNVVAPKK